MTLLRIYLSLNYLMIKFSHMKNTNLVLYLFLIVFSAGLISISSCGKDNEATSNDSLSLTKSFNSEIPLAWYTLLLDIDRYSPGYRPPAAARMMAYIGIAAYETVVPGMPDYQSLSTAYGTMNIPKVSATVVYHWPSALNAAYAQSFRRFYPQIRTDLLEKIAQLEKKYNQKFSTEIDAEVYARSIAFGKSVADAVYNYSATDLAGHEAFNNPRPSAYSPPKFGPNGEKLWQPTYPDYTAALFPYWGKVRTFALDQSEIRAKPPIPYSTDPNSKFYQQANETRILVDKLSFEDRWVSEFWSDDFFEVSFEPAARQVSIANQILETDKISLDRAVELYAKLGMAMADASIAIWNSKYIYNVLRPIEYIRDQMDPKWLTALNNPLTGVKSLTPEFPAYPSGHAGFGGSAALIFTDIFGSNHHFIDNCHVNRYEFIGAPRSFPSFIDAGIENAYSRLTLGVHYRMDSDEGLRLGYLAARRVLELPWKK